jgi:hypothetical protein
MKHVIATLALAATIMLARPSATAQPAAGDADVRAAVACLAGRDANSFAVLLRAPHLSHAERTEVGRLMPLLLRCREGSERFAATVIQLRAAVIAHLYAQQFAATQAPRTPPLAVAPLLRVDQARSRSEAEPLAATYTLLECLTAAQPGLIRAYLATPAGGEAEQAGFRALFPGLAACLPPNGSRQLAVGGARLRAILAEMLYRWSVVQRDGPTSPFAAAPAPAG